MFFGFSIGPFIVGGTTRKREDAEPEAFHDLSPIEAGGLILAFVFVVVCAVLAAVYTIAAWVDARGAGTTIATVLWLLIGFPLAGLALRALGKWGQRNF